MQDVLIILQAVPEDDLDCWVLMVIGETFRDSTVNLKSPVIINHKTNLAVQVILIRIIPYGRLYSARERGTAYADIIQKKGESIKIGDDIEIFVAEIKGDKVRLGISAPDDMKICRTELYLTVENNKEASDKVDLLKVFQLSRNLKALAQDSAQEEKEGRDGDT